MILQIDPPLSARVHPCRHAVTPEHRAFSIRALCSPARGYVAPPTGTRADIVSSHCRPSHGGRCQSEVADCDTARGLLSLGDVHTNTIEGAFSLFKRSIVGAFHKVSVKHLPAYLDEFEFCFGTLCFGSSTPTHSSIKI